MKRMTNSEANEYRLTANEIMSMLCEAGKREQLDLLRMYAESAITQIDNEPKGR